MEVKLNLLFFPSVPIVMQKVQKVQALIYRVIPKQRVKRKQAHPVCLHAVEKYEKLETGHAQNGYETASKK